MKPSVVVTIATYAGDTLAILSILSSACIFLFYGWVFK